MFVSHEEKNIFIHIPKSGGKSVTNRKNPAFRHDNSILNLPAQRRRRGKNRQPTGHATFQDILNLQPQLYHQHKYNFLATIRNPVAWYASFYAYYHEYYTLPPFNEYKRLVMSSEHNDVEKINSVMRAYFCKQNANNYSLENIYKNYKKIQHFHCGIYTKLFLSFVCEFSENISEFKSLYSESDERSFFKDWCRVTHFINIQHPYKHNLVVALNQGFTSSTYLEQFSTKEKEIINSKTDSLIVGICDNLDDKDVIASGPSSIRFFKNRYNIN